METVNTYLTDILEMNFLFQWSKYHFREIVTYINTIQAKMFKQSYFFLAAVGWYITEQKPVPVMETAYSVRN